MFRAHVLQDIIAGDFGNKIEILEWQIFFGDSLDYSCERQVEFSMRNEITNKQQKSTFCVGLILCHAEYTLDIELVIHMQINVC